MAASSMRYLQRDAGPLALIVCATLLAIGIAEAALRFFKLWAIPDYSQMNWYRPSDIPGVPYLLKPNLRSAWGIGEVHTDDFGLRNSHPPEKPAGVFRILMAGDSVTFGYGVDQTQSFPAVLETLLNKNAVGKYEVINAGIPGYSIADAGSLLPALSARYHPDLFIWTVTSNDYDDPLAIDGGGRIVSTNHVVDAGQIAAWGYDGRTVIDVGDFRRSMLPAAIAQAESRAPAAPPWDSWLSNHSFAYSFMKTQGVKLPRFPAAPAPSEVELLGRYQTANGHTWLMQFFSAVYSSRRAIERANHAIGAAKGAIGVPIILVNYGLPMDREWMISREQIVYQDIADYLGESAVDFFFRNNLRWDSHPSVKGNQTIAAALHRMLGCLGYSPAKERCAEAAAMTPESSGYWEEFQKRRQRFVTEHYGTIDLDRFRGVHQIVGGIFPSRLFPGPIARRANVLLGIGPWKSVTVWGTLAGTESMTLRFTVFAGEQSVVQERITKPGEVNLQVDLTPLKLESPREPPELQMECISAACPAMRIHRISADAKLSPAAPVRLRAH